MLAFLRFFWSYFELSTPHHCLSLYLSPPLLIARDDPVPPPVDSVRLKHASGARPVAHVELRYSRPFDPALPSQASTHPSSPHVANMLLRSHMLMSLMAALWQFPASPSFLPAAPATPTSLAAVAREDDLHEAHGPRTERMRASHFHEACRLRAILNERQPLLSFCPLSSIF